MRCSGVGAAGGECCVVCAILGRCIDVGVVVGCNGIWVHCGVMGCRGGVQSRGGVEGMCGCLCWRMSGCTAGECCVRCDV